MNADFSQSEGKMTGIQYHEYYAKNLNSQMDISQV